MTYGICSLTLAALRSEPSDRSEMVSQALYGEHFEILAKKGSWVKVKMNDDRYQGWMSLSQVQEISDRDHILLSNTPPVYATDIVNFVSNPKGKELQVITLGASVYAAKFLNQQYEGEFENRKRGRESLLETAALYLNTPYLWGGKSPFGIDCSGFTQMVYKINGHYLPRDAWQQAEVGEPLSFIEESSLGDLAFFHNQDGEIVHVGVLLEDHYIIHAYGKVRVDRLDQFGIYNTELGKHTHRLRVIKKIIAWIHSKEPLYFQTLRYFKWPFWVELKQTQIRLRVT